MSNAREDIFQSGLDQAIREERYRADQRRKETDGIDIVHLLCSCGERFKKKLLTDLLISSSLSFEKFMFGFFREHPGESQREILIIQQLATSRKDHPSVVLLEYLAKSERVYTVTDIVNNLEYAHLFRVIAGFEHQSIRALKEHFSLHRHSACCKAPFSRSKASQIVPRGLSQSGFSSGCRSNKAYRGIILLTFMNDGRHHAVQVKNILEKPSKESGRSYIVYTLSDFSHYVIENFMKHIIWIMSQVDFVVPILTEEYFQMLEEERDMDRSGLDEKYAPYVAEVLLAEWASSFRNKRLRSLKPQGVKWPSRPIYPPFLTCVDKPSALPSILIKSKE